MRESRISCAARGLRIVTSFSWSGARVLVAGGAGMIGSYLVEQLVDAGARVRVADNFERGSRDHLSAVLGRVEVLDVDLRDRARCAEVVRGMDVACNLAARTAGIGYSARHHAEMLGANALLSLSLLEAACDAGVPRFLLVSSSCVYDDHAPVPTPETSASHGVPERANEGYGWAKRLAEVQAELVTREGTTRVTVARPFNAYAPRYRWAGASSHLVPSLVKRVCDGVEPIVVWGSGRQRRNLLHARDLASLLRLVLERDDGRGPVNVGLEDTVSVEEIVTCLLRVVGRSAELVFDTQKPEGRAVKSADVTRLRSLVPEFRPSVALEEGMREMVAWYGRSFAPEARA